MLIDYIIFRCYMLLNINNLKDKPTRTVGYKIELLLKR